MSYFLLPPKCENNFDIIETSNLSFVGNSGSPLCNARGEVLGVFCQTSAMEMFANISETGVIKSKERVEYIKAGRRIDLFDFKKQSSEPAIAVSRTIPNKYVLQFLAKNRVYPEIGM